ncbi:tyrosine phosphatase [Ophiostoma piceae UAMH 11346]|uniref:Tyrosine phosphatase n=1 Tax=Ophiostoma piceae (strain UAMH 11346) TaxID=1262450 RepID=S3CGB5_OPHP1|nr:tyrosine phosphatase [Ophiostoma piceae UAMH 11346]
MSAYGAPNPETPTTLPSPPFVHLKGIPNFRDLGGSPIGDDGSVAVRRKYLFRCAEPTQASSEAVEKIRSLGITHIFDLRSLPEIERMQVSSTGSRVTEWPGVERVFTPVFRDVGYDPVSLAKRHADYQDERPEGMVNAYRAILTQGGPAYGAIMRHVAKNLSPDTGLIFHCTAGKDRTGVLGALILSMCGVSDDIVADEYNLTEAGLGDWTEFLVRAVMKQGAASEAGARRMVGARRESMLDTLKMIRAEFGGPEAYFEDKCGLSKKEIAEIKAFLTVKQTPEFS